MSDANAVVKRQSTDERWRGRDLESLKLFYRRKRRKVQSLSLLESGHK